MSCDRTVRLGTPTTWAQEVKYIDAAGPLATAEAARLRTVTPPTGEAIAYQNLMRAGVPLLQGIGPLRKAAIAEDMHSFRALALLSRRRQSAFDAIARSIGLDDCVGLRRG